MGSGLKKNFTQTSLDKFEVSSGYTKIQNIWMDDIYLGNDAETPSRLCDARFVHSLKNLVTRKYDISKNRNNYQNTKNTMNTNDYFLKRLRDSGRSIVARVYAMVIA